MKKAFTLIELLIVITIIGILMALAIASYAKTRAAARDAKRQSDLEQIKSALEIYRADNGQYPPPANVGWCTVIWGCGSSSSPNHPEVKNALINGGYLSQLPQDPRFANTSQDYFYRKLTNGYELYAQQEVGGTNNLSTVGCNCGVSGSEAYDYRVTNP